MQSRKRSAPPPASLTTDGESLPSLARGGGEWCGASSSRHQLKVRHFSDFKTDAAHEIRRLHQRPVEPFFGLPSPWAMPWSSKACLAASARCCSPFSARRWPCLLALVVRLFCSPGAALLPVLAVVVVPPCAARRASKTVMAVGHPFMGRGSRRRWGNPEGVPRSQTAFGASFFAGGRVIHGFWSFNYRQYL